MTSAEGIDCHLAKGGYLNLARNEPQVRRVHELLEYYRSWGFGEDDYRWLTAGEASARLDASNVRGAGYTPHCAAIHPARLVRGLAETVERGGATIYEKTRVIELGDRKVRCETGTVSADVVVRATEGFTARLPGHRRTVAPIYSLMIATEPLPDSFFDRGRLGATGDLQRRPAPDHLRPAHRRQPHRVRWPGRAVPLRLGDQAGVRPATQASTTRCAHAARRALPRDRRCPGHPSLGRPGRRAARLVLLRRFRSGERVRLGPAGTSATASPPPTWPGAPWPT